MYHVRMYVVVRVHDMLWISINFNAPLRGLLRQVSFIMQRKVVIMALTIKQKQVADDFIITGNRTKSYLKFYKNVKNRETAAAAASRLFSTPEVKEYIESKMKELDEELIADQREILRGLTKQFRREETDYQVVMTKKPRFDDNGNFLGMEEKPEVIKLPTQNKDSIKAGELLGKRFGMWTDKLELEASNRVVIVDDTD